VDAHKALSMWAAEGLISPELEKRLTARLEAEESSSRSSALISFFVSVGAVLVGGGLFLFIASHWDSESPLRRLLMLAVAYFVAVIAALVADRQELGVVAKGLWFLAAVTVGVNIFLIGQIYNQPLTYWQGTLLWLVAALAIGRAAPSPPLGWLAVGLAVLTLGWASVPESDFFDQGAFLWDQGGIRPLLPLLGLALIAASLLIDDSEGDYLVTPARVVGIAFIAVPIVASTFHPAAFAAVFQIDFRLFHFVAILLALIVIGGAWASSRHDLLAYVLGALLVLSLVFLPQVGQQPDAADPLDEFDSLPWLAEAFADSDPLFLFYGAFVFALALATVVLGRRFEIRALVNVGLVSVGVIVFAAYVGRIAGALPTSLAFLLGGVLLVAMAIFIERKRRDLTTETAVGS
jgi:uncharacterized membrane protein